MSLKNAARKTLGGGGGKHVWMWIRVKETCKADTEEKLDLLSDETASTGQVNTQIVNST